MRTYDATFGIEAVKLAGEIGSTKAAKELGITKCVNAFGYAFIIARTRLVAIRRHFSRQVLDIEECLLHQRD